MPSCAEKRLNIRKKKSKDLLLRGEALSQAKAFLVEGTMKHPNPIQEQIDYIEASKIKRKRDKQLRRTFNFVSIVLALVIAGLIPTLILLMGDTCNN